MASTTQTANCRRGTAGAGERASALPLREAHRTAERVEQAIAAEPEVASVQTHLEPIEQPESAAPGHPNGEGVAATRELVERLTGREPVELKMMRARRGHVAFLTVGVDPGLALADAHALAGRLEEEIRRAQPRTAEVVVHTEPLED